jgi:hypothetical protein
MPAPVIVDARRADTARLPHLTTEDVVFPSPVTNYPERTSASHMLTWNARALERIEPAEAWKKHHQVIVVFTARVADSGLDGVIDEPYDTAGLLTHVTPYLRPYTSLRQAMAACAGRSSSTRRDPHRHESVGLRLRGRTTSTPPTKHLAATRRR